jgi:hypothetical protein
MSKRLQVLIDDGEFREIQRLARTQKMTVAAWVRQVLRAARLREPQGDTDKKLHVIRAGSRHAFPVADIDQINAEIQAGYLGGLGR